MVCQCIQVINSSRTRLTQSVSQSIIPLHRACCYDEIKGTQDPDFSFSDSLSANLAILLTSPVLQEWISAFNDILVSIGADQHGVGGETSITPAELRCFEFLQPIQLDVPACAKCGEASAMTRFICSKKFRCKQTGCALKRPCKLPRWYCKDCADDNFKPPVATR